MNELTCGTFSYRMRPDPHACLVVVTPGGGVFASLCHLPHEHTLFVSWATTAALAALVWLPFATATVVAEWGHCCRSRGAVHHSHKQ